MRLSWGLGRAWGACTDCLLKNVLIIPWGCLSPAASLERTNSPLLAVSIDKLSLNAPGHVIILILPYNDRVFLVSRSFGATVSCMWLWTTKLKAGSLHLASRKYEEFVLVVKSSFLPKEKVENREPKLSLGSYWLTDHVMRDSVLSKYFPWSHFQCCFGVHMQIKYLERKKSKYVD